MGEAYEKDIFEVSDEEFSKLSAPPAKEVDADDGAADNADDSTDDKEADTQDNERMRQMTLMTILTTPPQKMMTLPSLTPTTKVQIPRLIQIRPLMSKMRESLQTIPMIKPKKPQSTTKPSTRSCWLRLRPTAKTFR